MKRIKSCIFDSIRIRDLNLTLSKDDVAEISDEFFYGSADLKKAIQQGQVIFEGQAHRGQIVKLSHTRQYHGTSKEASRDNLGDIHSRMNIMEKAVSTLLAKDYSVPNPKYDDYMLYTNTFMSSNYDGMIFDTFLDSSKRHKINAGNAIVRYGALTTGNDEDLFYFRSDEFLANNTICEFLPMARWTGDGTLIIHMKIGDSEFKVFDSDDKTNLLWTAINTDRSNKITATITLKSKNSKISLESYGLLFKM